jgi:hypothetical protein
MCYGCYERYGCPTEKHENTDNAVELIRELYETHLTGGDLHIITDDWNLEDGHLDWCGDETKDPLCIKILSLLKPMTIKERATTMAIVDGFI